MNSKSPTISIVIPVYNEADQLPACLDSIAAQITMPYEVIVVDNNSTDNSATIASKYNFVSVISEFRQGVVHARTTGFDAATGEIIARIDADSILPGDWTQKVSMIFKGQKIAAVSGSAMYYGAAYAGFFNALDLFFRKRLERQLGDRLYLWGANMAVRKSAWQSVKSSLCYEAGLHEDYDLAIHLQEMGYKVAFNAALNMHVSSRRIDVGYVNFMKYVLVSPDTYALHGIRRRFYMYEVVAVCAIGYFPARALHRGYNPQTDKFSLRTLFQYEQTNPPRVDPTTYVA